MWTRVAGCLILLFTIVVVQALQASWIAIAPEVFAEQSPVIVIGKIKSVEHPKEAQGRILDTATIEITRVVKNVLKDEPLKVGGLIQAKMSSTKSLLKTSVDISYPVGAEGAWMLVLRQDGFFLNAHPVQHLKVDKDGKMTGFDGKAFTYRPDDKQTTYTRPQWLQHMAERQKKAQP